MNSNSPAWQWWCAGQFLCLPNPYAVLENKSVLGNCKFWYFFWRKFSCIWENRNVEKSPKDEELIVPNWNCWSWLVGNNKRICCSANKWRRFAEKEFFRKKTYLLPQFREEGKLKGQCSPTLLLVPMHWLNWLMHIW